MTKLDLVLERIRKLPQAEQDALAADLESMLGDGSLSAEQERELQRRLADPKRATISHDDVAAFFEKKYGR